MSRIGKKAITLPQGVSAVVTGRTVTVRGPKGELSMEHQPSVSVSVEENALTVRAHDEEDHKVRALWGLTRALLQNMVTGVTEGFSKSLEVNGVGFKVTLHGNTLELKVGFSHPVVYALPAGITATVEKNTITVSGIDKQLVGQAAAEIRGIKKPEPYKGKGIKYADEVIRRKVGKVVKSAV